MPCHHKFQSYLDLGKIDFEPETLIIGSFNPALPTGNAAEWFYGRIDSNCFWDVLPRLYDQPSLQNAKPEQWKQFCHDHKIALTDLISSIDDADATKKEHYKILAGFSDKAYVYHFDDFEFVDVVQLLRRYPSIKNVYLTRGITEAFWRYVWNPIAHYCSLNNIHTAILLTPTPDSEYHHGAHNQNNPKEKVLRFEDYILIPNSA